MAAALELARSVVGRTGDNHPPVGCVIVRDGRIIGRGATQPPGGSHAEVMAVTDAESAGRRIEGSDVYVILEPCAFTGRTPPCSTMLVRRRPGRVITAVRDPHPQVRGAGLAELRAAGITVLEGVMETEVQRFLSGWLARFDPTRDTG